MHEPKHQSPFQTLGRHLKLLREARHESLAEVCGAVEIDINSLERIEQGEERPSEDILMLLINHFCLHEHEAVQLWESAGYHQPSNEGRLGLPGGTQTKPTLVLIALDARVLYSDGVSVRGDQKGLVMNFTQNSLQGGLLPVARVGVSYEQAEQVLKVLQNACLRHKYLSGPKSLPAYTDSARAKQPPIDEQ